MLIGNIKKRNGLLIPNSSFPTCSVAKSSLLFGHRGRNKSVVQSTRQGGDTKKVLYFYLFIYLLLSFY